MKHELFIFNALTDSILSKIHFQQGMNRMIKPRIVSIGDIIHGQLEFTLKILSKKEPTEFYCAIPSDAFVVSDTKGVALVNTITERFCELLSLQNSCKGIYVEKAL